MKNNTFYINEYCEYTTEYEKKKPKKTFLFYTVYTQFIF